MQAFITRTRLAVVAFGLLLSSTLYGQQKPEQYTAAWLSTGGPGGMVSINVFINKYNTDQEIKDYADTLKENGEDALRKLLEKEDVGQFSPVGRVGTPLAIARKLVRGDKTIIRVITLRRMSFAELRNSGRSVDFPYTMLEMVLDKDGKGSGTAIGAAKLSFNKKKKIYEIESFQHGADFNKLLNVQRAK